MCDRLTDWLTACVTVCMTDSATGRAIFTPQAYVRALKHALKKRNIMVNVEDILAVPDYVGFMQKHIDKNLSRCDKEEWTELEWTFEAVETSESYPTGVKVTYRKYTNDDVILVYEDEEQTYGFSSCKYKVNRHPMPLQPGDPDGMYLLSSLPDGTTEFLPQPFIKGSRKHLETLVRKIGNEFNKVPGVEKEWKHWMDHVAPKTDCATDFCRENPLQIPFWDELFSGSPVNTDTYVPPHVPKRRSGDEPSEYETTNSVIWSNRGEKSNYTFVYARE